MWILRRLEERVCRRGLPILVIETAAGIHVKFMTAKTRVSLLQQQTIPRLELLSAVILAKLMANLTKILQAQLTLSPSICYTDSQVAFYWIIGTSKEWKQFVYTKQLGYLR